MFISKRKWNQLEKRVADLEGQVQDRLEVKFDSEVIRKELQQLKRKGKDEQRLIRNPYEKRFHAE